MARFSVTEAASAGFGVVTHKPLAVLGWAVALLVAMVVPLALGAVALGPQLVKFFQLAMAQPEGATPSPEMLQQALQTQMAMTGLNLLFWLWSSFVKAVFAGAVFRAVLTPEQSAWAYLRVGSREMWLTLLLLVEQVLAMIVMFVLVLLVVVLAVVVAMAAGGESGQAAGVLVGCAAGFGAAGVLIWLALRLSMAAPMTFVDNQFRLFESWTLTRGQGWRLLGMTLLIVLFVLCLEIVFGGVAIGALIAGAGQLPQGHDEAWLRSFLQRPPMEWLRDLWPWILGFSALGAVFAALVQAVFYAPWAAVHRALTSEP